MSSHSKTLRHEDDDKTSLHSRASGSSSTSYPEGTETSTLRYCQEPWDVYRPRVEKLCRTLWPPQQGLMSRVANSRILTWARTIKFADAILPGKHEPVIERMCGGDYNRITGITLPRHPNLPCDRLILRKPREPNFGHPDRDEALLNFLREKSSIPVVQSIAHDFSSDNPLESPYVIQKRIPGESLEQMWPSLNQEQRSTIACEVGAMFRTLFTLQSPVTGIADVPSSDETGSLNVIAFELMDGCGGLIKDPGRTDLMKLRESPNYKESTRSFFETQIARWRAHDVRRNLSEEAPSVQLWDKMLDIVREMDTANIFLQDSNCLCHTDLEPRNIMAETKSDGSIKITAILDWDEAVVAPNFVNCKPPLWLWRHETSEDTDEDIDLWPLESARGGEVPDTEDNRQLKQVFEESAGPEYVRMAYDQKYRLCRGLFALATRGLTCSDTWKAADAILAEWKVLRESLIAKS
ncbi:uncharacterized protein KY384_007361 [Bacidia gigantensis]|uniref:uncharacterized protein n=1 Tax=Bacidia gigantensis TaxID=2732470 RepID=UPI001D03E361|nr:uncharacterized protein KY384_007361 [Bacidia gigantensis]KAG8528443.1 hypothetical protein KY384_007361 [Bacidia gigantensis]